MPKATPVHPSKAGKAQRTRQAPREALVGTKEVLDIHRTLPHSVEAEQGVLGSMLLSPRSVIGECIEKIGPDYFYVPAHQTVYMELVDLWKANAGIDLVTFTQVLRDKKVGGSTLLDQVGGASFVTSLFTFVPTAANISYYLEILLDKYILRQIIASSTESVRRAYEEQDEVQALLAEVEKSALSIRPKEQTRVRPIKDAVMDALEGIEKLWANKSMITGISTGFYELDRMTGGLQNQDMNVIAARPSMGKTSLAMNIAEHVGVKQNIPLAVFSMEMSEQQLMQRLLASMARVNLQKIREGFLQERDFPALTAAASKIAESNLIIDDEKLYVDVLVARCRRLKAEKGIKLVIIDYLQLLKASGFKPSERQQEVSYISGSIKGLAKDLNIPVVVLAQLNRQPEARSGGKPRLSDLRESGSIEQDADFVGLLIRGEVYEEDQESRKEKEGEAELIIAKQRNGPLGEVPLTFLKEITRFEDRARHDPGLGI